MTQNWRTIAGAVAIALALTGCSSAPDPTPIPTGNALVAQAKQHYFDYRTVTNDVQALIFDGPWEANVGSFGMEPAGAGCDDDYYRFDLARTTRMDAESQDEASAKVLDYLTAAGYTIEGQDLGSGESQSRDLIVRDQGDFSQLMVTFIGNGAVLVTAATECWPGNRTELSKLIFGGVNLLEEGYLPREESPSDPLFFGVTPGEPGFLTD